MPKNPRAPSYRLHKPSGQAVVTFGGKDYYLGKHATPASRAAYDRLVAEWLVNGRRAPHEARTAVSVCELMAAYLRFAAGYYRKDGRPTKEVSHIKHMISVVKPHYRRQLVTEFGPLALKTVREQLVTIRRSRVYINDTIARVKRMFKWGVETELVPPSVYHGLQAVAGLKRGRCEARETEPVRPVPDAHVEAIKPHVSRQVWAMVELQRLTGMRPGEVVIMRGRDLDTTGSIWLYRPESHKTQHHGHERIIEFGPRAQAELKAFLKPEVDTYLFSPRDAMGEQREAKHARRKTPPSCGNRPGTNRKPRPKRQPGDRYTPDSYRRAITRGCDLADEQAKRATRKPPDGERIVPRWHPHQLRHNYATRVRREYGVETARILLGHRSVAVTEVYAEVDRSKARAIVAKIG